MDEISLKLIRESSKLGTTLGALYVNGVFECWTCEDELRTTKIFGKTAIWAGIYKVILSMSRRFKRVLPEILAVPGFEGVRIHAGNTAQDTEGCILVGRTKAESSIGESRLALDALMGKLVIAHTIHIEIVNPEEPHAKV